MLPSFTASSTSQATAPASQSAREDAYRANNIGVALLEQYKFDEAARSFRRALEIDPKLTVARINLSIALYYMPNIAEAMREAEAAARSQPDFPHPRYILGLIAKSQNRTDDAVASFQRVLQIDSQDLGAIVNLAQLYMQQRKYEEAIRLLRAAVAAEPYNVTATYNLATALMRAGLRDEGQRAMQRFQSLRQTNYGTALGQNYMEQGRYSEAIASTGAEPDLVDPAVPDVTFTNATAGMVAYTAGKQQAPAPAFGRNFRAGELATAAKREIAEALAGPPALFDYDGDGDLDLFDAGPAEQRLYRNDGGKFADVTAQSGLIGRTDAIGLGAVAGDYDNDGKADLFVLRYGGSSLYHNEGGGKFSDATSTGAIPAYPHLSISAAFVDIDHDGDLDIFIAGFADLAGASGNNPPRALTFPDDFAAAQNMLLRNNGNGKFTDVTAEARIPRTNRAVAVVPTDYDNRRDVDLLVVNYDQAPTLLGNLRDGSFRNIAPEVGLDVKGRFTCVAAADVNKDDFTDFFFGQFEGPGLLAISDGRGRFVTSRAPAGSEATIAAQFIDYDNDGLIDLVTFSNESARAWRNVGEGWSDVTDRAINRDLLTAATSARALASGDLDGDADTDMIVRLAAGGLRFARNENRSGNRSLRVRLAGRVSNRNGIGVKIELRAGSHKQKIETCAATPSPVPADIVLGLGKRTAADALRVLWPSGILQSETEVAKGQPVAIIELDRKPSSCPYLFAWNGERFEFITDFLGGGEMGYWHAPGVYSQPDSDEYVRIREGQLRERNGRYELRITNELEEVLYLDRLQLLAVAHQADAEVFPKEGLVDPPNRSLKLYAAHNARPPVAAVDDDGRDMLPLIRELDRHSPDGFKLHKIRGYSERHTLTLDLGANIKERALLLLTGWTDYAFSSDNLAAYQSGLSLRPPKLQVKDAQGRWRTVISNIGIPVGRPQTVPVDLTGKFLTADRQVRIVTNMRIHWDQILVATLGEDYPFEIARVDPKAAELRWRGYSAEVSPDGREPFGYDYSRVTPTSPWKVLTGRYTREGDVRELLLDVDDMFVICRPGDEISLSFDAAKLPRLRHGWRRTFLLYADGFSKEMDINSASPDAVEPLPFHAMTRYPYSAPESYPMTRARRRYIELYNNRTIPVAVPRIEAIFAAEGHK
jgi:tetratricopeptide (TPR) repeat protein